MIIAYEIQSTEQGWNRFCSNYKFGYKGIIRSRIVYIKISIDVCALVAKLDKSTVHHKLSTNKPIISVDDCTSEPDGFISESFVPESGKFIALALKKNNLINSLFVNIYITAKKIIQ